MQVYEYVFTRRRVSEVPIATMREPRGIALATAPLFAGAENECFVVVMLDTRNRIIGTLILYMGNVSMATVRVGEVFRAAVRLSASSIVVAHNHPSTMLDPSPDDLHLTAELIAAGKLLDIPVLDHLIVDGGIEPAYVSLRDRGVMFNR